MKPPRRQRHERAPEPDLAALACGEDFDVEDGLEDFDDFINDERNCSGTAALQAPARLGKPGDCKFANNKTGYYFNRHPIQAAFSLLFVTKEEKNCSDFEK
ncbi:MAG TPA: hypothetical protein DHV59_14455 [Oxalobacteraceae bacterium]|nr:hypothetical protein [Oxalobacteraceae bacterium]